MVVSSLAFYDSVSRQQQATVHELTFALARLVEIITDKDPADPLQERMIIHHFVLTMFGTASVLLRLLVTST
jgi:hypothetical protein